MGSKENRGFFGQAVFRVGTRNLEFFECWVEITGIKFNRTTYKLEINYLLKFGPADLTFFKF